METKLLTVVVPVYKVERYIQKCLNSLILQNHLMDKLEVIVVNDGSPDKSTDIASEYEKLFPSVFRIIDKDNGGHGSACNRGLKEARGRYIRFLDSDDWFDNSGFAVLMEKLENIDADIVFSDYYRYYMDDNSCELFPVNDVESDQVIAVECFDWSSQNRNISNFWYCTYKTELLQPLWPLFLEGISYDDSILFVAPLIRAKTVCYIKAPVYYYLIGRPGQSMGQGNIKCQYKARHKTHMQVFDYYLAHAHEVNDSGRKEVLTRILRNMLREDLVALSYSSYNDQSMMAEWCERCGMISRFLTIPSELLDSRRKFINVPYPLYYWLRRAKKIIRPNRN